MSGLGIGKLCVKHDAQKNVVKKTSDCLSVKILILNFVHA